MDIRASIIRYCNYQERCHQEVRDKLYELGAHTGEVNQFIADLIDSGLLNEERFAKAYVRGKFRMKQWGRVKIIQGLKQHRISPYLIQKSLKEISPDDYFGTALKLANKKWATLSGSELHKKSRLFRYLYQRGYENNLIGEVMQLIISDNKAGF